jgi:hypothetical protein
VPVLKPTRGLRLNKSHPLARGLVGCWLMNEGSGNRVFDLSGNGNIVSLVGPTWVGGNRGIAPQSDGTDDDGAVSLDLSSTGVITIAFSMYRSAFNNDDDLLAEFTANAGVNNGGWMIDPDSGAPYAGEFQLGCRSTSVTHGRFARPSVGWHDYAIVFDISKNPNTITPYVDGVAVAVFTYGAQSTDISTFANSQLNFFSRNGSSLFIDCKLDYFYIFNRALSAFEIALLYREPFCMFARAGRSELIGGQIVNFAGTSAALSSLSAAAKAMRKVGGNVASISDVKALLNSIRGRLETERNWLREALFNGMTANAFKLGTTLSLGWFWVRIAGCSVLYRGSGMEEIDFVNILAVAEQDAYETSPPSYIPHNSGSTYFYVIRRFNNCGYQECTLAAAVKVSIESNGELAEPQPNKVFDSGAELVDGNQIQLVWFYCPLAQKSQPACFNVYYDNRTGQINYQNPLATIGYKGRKFYSFQSSTLEAGKYLFAIRPKDASDIENSSLAQLRIQLDTAGPEAIDILRAEAV